MRKTEDRPMEESNPSNVTVTIRRDAKASVYVAVCDEIGLALESESYDRLVRRVEDAVPELLELSGIQIAVLDDGDGFIAKDLRAGVASQGYTAEEAIDNLKEALALYRDGSCAREVAVSFVLAGDVGEATSGGGRA